MMTDTPEPTTEPADEPADEPIEDGATFTADYVRKLRDEASEHRRARREAEQRIETLTTDLDALRGAEDDRQVAERLAPVLADPEDLWRYADRSEFTGEDGALDLDAVEQRALALVTERRHLAPPRPLVSADQGIRGQHVTPPPNWSDVLQQT